MRCNSQRAHLLLLAIALAGCSGVPAYYSSEAGGAGAMQASVPEKARIRFDFGVEAMQAGHWEEAVSLMEKVWEDYPEYSGPALNIALIHQQQAQADMAETWFLRAIAANDGNVEARNAYALFLRRSGRFQAAREQYQAALYSAPDHAASHYNLAILCDLYLGKKALALKHFSRYQALQAEEDRRVSAWIADLERQVALAEAGTGGAW